MGAPRAGYRLRRRGDVLWWLLHTASERSEQLRRLRDGLPARPGLLDGRVRRELPRRLPLCGSMCVETANDPAHCGTCSGRACPSGTVCSASYMQRDVPGRLDALHARRRGPLVRPDGDPSNCGACGNACPSGEVCSASTCGVTMPGRLDALHARRRGPLVRPDDERSEQLRRVREPPAPASSSARTALAGAPPRRTGNCSLPTSNAGAAGAAAGSCAQRLHGGSCTYTCDASGWTQVSNTCVADGSTAASAGFSCQALLSAGVTASGTYWINPGSGACRTYLRHGDGRRRLDAVRHARRTEHRVRRRSCSPKPSCRPRWCPSTCASW